MTSTAPPTASSTVAGTREADGGTGSQAVTAGRRLAQLAILCSGTLMIILGETIVNVALPSMQRDLGFSQPHLAWIVNAYLIAFGGLLLLAGRLGDLVGRRRLLVAGLVVFTAASLLCGLAQTQSVLLAARFAQGVGAAMTAAVTLGMIVTLFPQPMEQARAIGAYSFVGAAGASIGVLAGGLLTQVASWHWIFFVNVPIGVAAMLLARWLLPADRTSGASTGGAGGADVAGAVLITTGLMLVVYTVVGTAERGWTSAYTLGFGLLGGGLIGAFVVRQRTARRPLLPLEIFRFRQVTVANLVQALMVAAMFGFQFLIALFLQRVLRYTPAQTGLAFLPITVVIGVVSIGAAARLQGRFGPRAVLVSGLALLAVGLGLLTRTSVSGSYLATIAPAMVLLGVGAGLALPAATTLAMTGAPSSHAGLASGLVNTTQQVGGALGLAVLATVATWRTDRLTGAGERLDAALTGGYHLAFGIGAGLMVLALALAAGLLPGQGKTPADQGSAGVHPDR
ncbi:MAG TPA: MFS transporter [Micromonosporaceae bacterium]|nr:MFS transporter [Micromonosporaceae bacterium]